MLKNRQPVIWLAYVSYPITTAAYFERALRKKYNVITCGPFITNEIIKKWDLENYNLPIKRLDISTDYQINFRNVLNSISKEQYPDLYLWIESIDGYYPEDINGNGFPTACYLIDTHINLSVHLEWAKNFNYVFIAQREYIPEFKKNGIENVYWLPVGCDPEIHKKNYIQKKYDIGFVGSIADKFHIRRAELLNKLNSVFKVYGKRCFIEEMAEFFSASKIIFNNAVLNDLNMRLFEAMSTGSFLLTDNAKNSGQEEMFKDGEDLGIYNDDNIIEVADYYLKHETEREKIALRGQQIMYNAHTYSHRAEELIKVCFGEKKDTPTAEEWRERSVAPFKSVVQVSVNNEVINKSEINRMKRSFIIPVLDMSPASPYNIVKLLDDLSDIEGDVIIIFNSLEMADKLKDHPRINYYAAMKENVGVSRAWNIGLNISQTPVSFILNSDVHVEKESIEIIEKYLLELPDAAIAGPQGSFFNFNTLKDIAYFEKGTFNKPFAVDAVSGFFFAVKTELFNSGTIKFDNQYSPCYYEEWDIGLQCKMAGLKTYIIPVTGFEHEWSGSIRALKTVRYLDREETLGAIHEKNTKLFINKWNGINQISGNKDLLVSIWAGLMSTHAESLIEQKNFDEAIKVYSKILEKYPEDIHTLSKIAALYYNNNKMEDALKYFNMIASINPDFELSSNLLNGQIVVNKTPTANPGKFIKKSNSPNPLSKRITSYYENPRTDIQQLVGTNSNRILDIGCGSGMMAFELKNNLNAEVWGVELDDEAAHVAADRIDHVICSGVENAINDLPDNYFDTIIFADVLEHLVNPNVVLEQIKSKLTPEGEIIASIPNIRFWPVIRHLIEGHWTYQDSGILDRTHLRFFTFESINELFKNAGYELVNNYGNYVNSVEISQEIINTFNKVGINTQTLNNEGKCFQFLIRAKRIK